MGVADLGFWGNWPLGELFEDSQVRDSAERHFLLEDSADSFLAAGDQRVEERNQVFLQFLSLPCS